MGTTLKFGGSNESWPNTRESKSRQAAHGARLLCPLWVTNDKTHLERKWSAFTLKADLAAGMVDFPFGPLAEDVLLPKAVLTMHACRSILKLVRFGAPPVRGKGAGSHPVEGTTSFDPFFRPVSADIRRYGRKVVHEP